MTYFKSVVVLVLAMAVLTSCVTTSNSRYDKKKDYAKAERTYIQIGYTHFENNNMLEAKKALIKAIDINSKSAGAHLGLARIYDREQDHELADDHFKKALRGDATTEIHFQYAVYLYNRADLNGAYRQFKAVLKDTVYERRANAFEYQGVVTQRLEKYDEALVNFRRAIALNAMLANSHVGMSNIYFDQQDYVQAYQAYQGFIRLVQSQLARHNAATLWLGIQLAANQEDIDALSSYELQLRNRFAESEQYQLYQAWKAEKDAA